MAKLQAAHNRLFKNIFICKKCKTKIRAEPKKILEGKVKCRKCGRRSFRALKRK